MAKDIKKEIIAELDRRMDLLREHQYDQIQITGNEYSCLLYTSGSGLLSFEHRTLYPAFLINALPG